MVEYNVKSEQYEITGFCLIYGQKDVFSGRTKEDWDRAPKENVQLLLLYLDEATHMGVPYRIAVKAYDYYAFDGERYTASHDTRLISGDIKYGWWMPVEEWKNLMHWSLREMKKPGGAVDANR